MKNKKIFLFVIAFTFSIFGLNDQKIKNAAKKNEAMLSKKTELFEREDTVALQYAAELRQSHGRIMLLGEDMKILTTELIKAGVSWIAMLRHDIESKNDASNVKEKEQQIDTIRSIMGTRLDDYGYLFRVHYIKNKIHMEQVKKCEADVDKKTKKLLAASEDENYIALEKAVEDGIQERKKMVDVASECARQIQTQNDLTLATIVGFDMRMSFK